MYPWPIFHGDVRADSLGFGFGYNHGGKIPVFFFDDLGPSDVKKRYYERNEEIWELD